MCNKSYSSVSDECIFSTFCAGRHFPSAFYLPFTSPREQKLGLETATPERVRNASLEKRILGEIKIWIVFWIGRFLGGAAVTSWAEGSWLGLCVSRKAPPGRLETVRHDWHALSRSTWKTQIPNPPLVLVKAVQGRLLRWSLFFLHSFPFPAGILMKEWRNKAFPQMNQKNIDFKFVSPCCFPPAIFTVTAGEAGNSTSYKWT